MNPTLRGLLLVAAVSALIVALSLESTLVALSRLAQIAFFLAAAFFLFLVWRERRSEIQAWSGRGRAVFYGAALVVLVDLGTFFFDRPSGLDAVAFLVVLALAVFAMVRVWRDERRLT